jgi:iron(III) transport system ATP-binding protein
MPGVRGSFSTALRVPYGEVEQHAGQDAIAALGVSKSFGGTTAVDGATVVVREGEIVALLGPSGSGKTTLLRLVAGFEAPDAGTVSIGGRAVAGAGTWVEPERRRVGMVFQDGALFPHLTVAGNVGFGHPRAGRVEECLELVGLADRARSYPHELSGGERQRVALARALATEPAVVLLDEPFASLDASLRTSLREEVADILRRTDASALFVTHDQQEALSLADRITLLRDGCVEQEGPPEEIYAHPASRWAAGFLGAVDVLPGTVADGMAVCELGRFPADGAPAGEVDVLVRPEAVAIGPIGMANGDTNSAISARVVSRAYYGPHQLVELELASGQQLRSRRAGFAHWSAGDQVTVWIEGPVKVLAAEPR